LKDFKDRDNRQHFMKVFRSWLQEQDRTQRWAAEKLQIYHGYLSNLLTGKQVPSVELCQRVKTLMGEGAIARLSALVSQSRPRRFRHLNSLELRTIVLMTKSYLKSHSKVTPDELLDVVRSLRAGLITV